VGFIFLVIISTVIIVLSDVDIAIGNVAVIPLKGVILTQGQDTIIGPTGLSSMDIVKNIEKADSNPKIKAILIEINSPGGTAVASDEIAQALENTEKLKVAWIREIGTSGAYWVASECDLIVANKMSITGSIGVISSYLDFSGMLHDYNVTYQRLVAGDHKDIGSPFKELNSEEREILQEQLDIIHDIFIDEIAANRGLSRNDVENLATGTFYLGIQAEQLGLVDLLGNRDDAVAYIEEKIGQDADLVYYEKKEGLIDILTGVVTKGAFNIGQGFAHELTGRRANLV